MASEFNSMEDLVFSRSFRNWVLNRDSPERGFWENWLKRNPDKAEMVKYAKAAVYSLQQNTTVLSADEIDEEIRKALVRLKDAPRYIPIERQEARAGRWIGLLRSRRLWVAVLLTAGVAVGGSLFYRAHFHGEALQFFLASHRKETVYEQTTAAGSERALNLPDGGLVRLGKNSKLYYCGDCREVFLDGEAVFHIRRNPAVPFSVYTGQVIAKALGTDFSIHSLGGDDRTTVTAIKGQVLVYRPEDFFAQDPASREAMGIVLTPNQAAIGYRGEDRLHKTLAERPVPLEQGGDTLSIYHAAPVRQVLGELQVLYGIPIQFDQKAVDSCWLTATMGNEPFFDKLNLVCKVIGGSYEVIDGNVVLTARGCRER